MKMKNLRKVEIVHDWFVSNIQCLNRQSFSNGINFQKDGATSTLEFHLL